MKLPLFPSRLPAVSAGWPKPFNGCNARPHPGPRPRGEGIPATRSGDSVIGNVNSNAVISTAAAGGSPSPWGEGRGEGGRHSHLASGPVSPRAHQRGIALVVTLILLGVITFLTVAFLFLSQRERGAVATAVDQATARLATEAAVERAKTEMIAQILGTTNRFDYDLRVSTNFINDLGFISGNTTLTNVNYDRRNDGALLTQNDLLQNIANLYYSPRPPVFIQTNKNFPNALDFRFWLDLNRNGRFDTNGLLPELDRNGDLVPSVDNNGNPTFLTNFFVGDPEWIGILDRTDRPHAANNKFVSRFAFIVVPSGKTLDLNAIHNMAKRRGIGQESFIRNMGVGTWEFNLASFLVDLNTNAWNFNSGALPPAVNPSTYFYRTNINNFSDGTAFDDARAIVSHRYGNGGNYNTLRTVRQLFGDRGATAFQNDLADGYTDGLLMLGKSLPLPDNDNPDLPWPGAENLNHFLTTQDLFDRAKTTGSGQVQPNTFTDRLLNAGTGTSSYDRYTFYRLLSQLGTGTGPEPAGKLHLNYNNVDNAGRVVPNKQTNFVAWEPVEFFTNAVDRLLQANLGDPTYNARLFNVNAPISITNIPVYVSNRFVYSPSLHRLMQLAANVHDATTNFSALRGADLPSVFRPTFRKNVQGDIFVAGWVEETNSVNLFRPLDPTDPVDYAQIGAVTAQNVYGVPWVIGAKKGLPNFNEFMLQSVVSITRRLQFNKLSGGIQTNQMFMVSISSAFGFEAWNSYAANYNRPVEIRVENDMQIRLAYTNDAKLDLKGNVSGPYRIQPSALTNIAANAWRGAGRSVEQPAPASFVIPLFTNFVYLPESVYRTQQPGAPFFRQNTNQGTGLVAGFEQTGDFYIPQFNLNVSNRIRFIMIDTASGRVIDYVHLSQLDGVRNLTAELGDENTTTVDGGANVGGLFWATNRPGGNANIKAPPQGVIQQIEVSLGNRDYGDWKSYGVNQASGATKDKAIAGFRAFMGLSQINPKYVGTVNNDPLVQAPFTPTRRTSQTLSWQANDPLVHYTKSDLAYLAVGNGIQPERPTGPINLTNNIGKLNKRFEPWSENLGETATRRELALKDPLIWSSDSWDFPTNQFASVGWLGRVHRGTPWQTVYLKSADANPAQWTNWTGNARVLDAFLTRPVADRVLFDVFTAAVDENATRGQLNVNQEGLAAWSAALGGLITLTNIGVDAALRTDTNFVDAFILDPAGVSVDPTNSPVHRIWAGVNRTRTDRNQQQGSFYPTWFRLITGQNFNPPPNRNYQITGAILDVPELTVQSPVLNRSDAQLERGIDDATYERIPQMLMGLLRGNETPRFTIYAYGQALKPAERSVVTSGSQAGLVANYQITAEFVTRTVVRLDVTEGVDSTGNRIISSIRPVIESYNVLGPD